MKAFIVSKYQRIKTWYAKYERLLMSATLVGGFLVDFIAFVNIDLVFKFIVLSVYWAAAGFAITFMQVYDAGKISRRLEYARLFMPLVIQWTFGGLLNISLIFYWFSGAFSVSWPLLAITVILLLSNDSFRNQFSKPVVQISVYFFVTFSLFTLVFPFLFSSLSAWLFMAATAASVGIFIIYIHYLSVLVGRTPRQRNWLFVCVLLIAGFMNGLYFTNIIPPIPLALREAGLYHNLSVSGNQYTLSGEPENFLQIIQAGVFGQTLHLLPKEKVYLYTSIFAPNNLKTTIVHNWQYYDEAQKAWINQGKLSFAINGGRQEGYKGYSWQSDLAPGRWRVYVQNQRGQVLGIVRFTVESVQSAVPLETTTK